MGGFDRVGDDSTLESIPENSGQSGGNPPSEIVRFVLRGFSTKATLPLGGSAFSVQTGDIGNSRSGTWVTL